MSRRTAESSKAILAAWVNEQKLVQEGKGTREWTPQQQQDILEKGKAYDDNGKAIEGQHMKSAEMYPEYQGEPGNIQFLTRAEHLEAHDGNWQNPTNWYYNPATKEKIDFGDGPFIPCEIIQLPETIMEVQTEHSQETNNAQKSETTEEKINSHENNKSKNVTIKVKPKPNFGQRLNVGFQKVRKAIVEFPAKHPTATKILGFAATIATAYVSESSKNKSYYSGHGSSIDNYNEDYDDIPSSYDNDSGATTNDMIGNVIDNENSYTPNDVPAGKQRYHYKDGSIKWVNKKPYHRSGNSDE